MTTKIKPAEVQHTLAEIATIAKLRGIELPSVQSITNRGFVRFQRTYRHNPLAFIHDCFDWSKGEGPTRYQDQVAELLPEKHRIALVSPRGAGKTAEMAQLILWALLTVDDVKVPITAGDWGQLEKYLWPEIHKWAKLLLWDTKVRHEPFTTRQLMSFDIVLSKTCLTRTASPQDTAKFEGAHAVERVMVCYDEAKVVRAEMYDAAEGSFSKTEEPLALAFSTPSAPIGRFYDICTNREGRYSDWHTVRVTKEDQIAAGRLSLDFVDKRAKQWGVNSALYLNHIEGQFAADDTNTIIPYSYILAAMDNWCALRDSGVLARMPLTALACDPAAGGGDKSVIAYKGTGNVVMGLKEYDYQSTAQTSNLIKAEAQHDRTLPIYLDVAGIGTGIFDFLHEDGYNVIPFNASSAAEGTDSSGEIQFLNKRAESWFQTSVLLDPAKNNRCAIPLDDDLKGELNAPIWEPVRGGKKKVQSKDELRKKLGRSTDHADPVIMALVGGAICHPYETTVETFEVDWSPVG